MATPILFYHANLKAMWTKGNLADFPRKKANLRVRAIYRIDMKNVDRGKLKNQVLIILNIDTDKSCQIFFHSPCEYFTSTRTVELAPFASHTVSIGRRSYEQHSLAPFVYPGRLTGAPEF